MFHLCPWDLYQKEIVSRPDFCLYLVAQVSTYSSYCQYLFSIQILKCMGGPRIRSTTGTIRQNEHKILKFPERFRSPSRLWDEWDDEDGDFEEWEIHAELREHEDYPALVGYCQRRLRRHPDDPYSKYYLGEAYVLNGQHEAAIEFMRHILSEEKRGGGNATSLSDCWQELVNAGFKLSPENMVRLSSNNR